MKVGIRLPACQPADQLAEAAVRAERLGFDQVWVPDSQLLWRDPFTTLAMMAARTQRLRLGTAVTNLVTRHPSVVASAARTVAELAPERFVLGVGVGNSAVEPIGLRPAPAATLRHRLGQVRALLAGEEVDWGSQEDGDRREGRWVSWEDGDRREGRRGAARSRLRDPVAPPVYLAASGPRNLRLAGELADGVILLSGVSPEPLARSIAQVRAGAQASGRKLSELDVTVSSYCHITDDPAADARMLKPICAAIAQHGGRAFLALAGIEAQVPPEVPELYPDTLHAEDWDRAVEVCGRWVTDRMAVQFAQAFCLFGTAEQVAARLAEVAAAGATSVFLQHVGSYQLPYELMDSFADSVLWRVRG